MNSLNGRKNSNKAGFFIAQPSEVDQFCPPVTTEDYMKALCAGASLTIDLKPGAGEQPRYAKKNSDSFSLSPPTLRLTFSKK